MSEARQTRLKPSVNAGGPQTWRARAPLTAEERLTAEELDQEVRQNWGFIHKIASGWSRRNPAVDYDDLFGAACLGFVRAAERYDRRNPRGAKFTTYAKWWADNQIRDLLDHEDRRLGPRSIRSRREGMPRVQLEAGLPHANAFHEDGSDRFLETFAAPEPEPRPGLDLWDRVRAVLPPREYEILRLYFDEDLNYAEVGQLQSPPVCRERIRQLVDRALLRLRSHLDPSAE